jgi:small-conductance mechanosensitive channel
MTTWFSGVLPHWASLTLLSAILVAAGYTAGVIVKGILGRRLQALASRSTHTWDDAVVAEVFRRVPFWGLLLGVYIAAGYWTLPPHVATTVNKALIVLVGVSVTLVAASVAASMTRDYGRAVQGDLPVSSLSQNVARILIVIVGALTILHGLGVSIAPMLTALGVGGLAVALALQDTLANLFAGIHVSLARQVRVGDYIRLDTGEEGYLIDIAWRSASIRMLANNIVIVPNAKLAQAIVTNYTLADTEMSVQVQVGVDYASDLAHVERVTIEVARQVMATVTGGVPTADAFIRYHTFGDSSINFSVIMRAREFVDQYLIKHEFVMRLHERYATEGITIPFPIRTLVAGEGGLRISGGTQVPILE